MQPIDLETTNSIRNKAHAFSVPCVYELSFSFYTNTLAHVFRFSFRFLFFLCFVTLERRKSREICRFSLFFTVDALPHNHDHTYRRQIWKRSRYTVCARMLWINCYLSFRGYFSDDYIFICLSWDIMLRPQYCFILRLINILLFIKFIPVKTYPFPRWYWKCIFLCFQNICKYNFYCIAFKSTCVVWRDMCALKFMEEFRRIYKLCYIYIAIQFLTLIGDARPKNILHVGINLKFESGIYYIFSILNYDNFNSFYHSLLILKGPI